MNWQPGTDRHFFKNHFVNVNKMIKQTKMKVELIRHIWKR
jgi:hypothetical protein